MSADVILFPAAHRIGFARRQADAVARYSPEGRQRTIEHALGRQAKAFQRLGADPSQIAAHVADLRIAIEALIPNGRRSAR